MILSLHNQGVIFLTTVVVGILMGYFFDLFRLIRKIVKHSNFMTNIEDILYWVIVTFFAALVLLHKDFLQLRFFSILGIFIGLIFYFLAISFIVMKINLFILQVIKFIINVLLFPVRLILQLLKPIFVFVNNKAIRAKYRKKIMLQKVGNYGKIKRNNIISTIKIMKNKV